VVTWQQVGALGEDSTSYGRPPGYLLVWLEHARPEDVRERLLDAWLLMAPKQLAATLAG
jgi:hypothetical protein